ncbi:MAG TPA: hypothetical protein VFI02_19100 [Armatimonadota bacterium]|nr:hypothetical protein [Armatimonadota bacterium]
MSFSYLVPYTRLVPLLSQIDKRLHPGFVERLRVEIHAELTRSMQKPGTFKAPSGTLSSSITSWVSGRGIVLHSPLDYARFVEEGTRPHRGKIGQTVKIPGIGYRKVTWKSMMEGKWQYPGAAGKRLFANAVDAVLLRGGTVVREYDAMSRRLR